MAMYYESRSELIEAENNPIHTLYLMNPNYIHTTPPPPHPQSSPAQDISAMWGGGGEIGNYHQQPQPQHAADGLMMMMGSKYLKAAQELLDELVNVGSHRTTDKPKPINKEVDRAANTAAADLTPTQRQEIQIKKAKLHTMLDEVEQRCRQYHQQMQMIVAAFEQVAGPGSARSYTQLALKTILKQFRCLKSTITAQVKALSKSLGEVEQGSEMSRLRFVDPQPQPQVHNNAWRPQRGLPERAVSVLRAWLFQHFLHPYPKDSDKQMLAKQTGLTRSQVSNWFINARVRVWKPMVEEMYLQETNNNAAPPSIKAEPAAASSPLKKRSIDNNESMLHQTNAFSLSLALPPFLPFDFQPSPLDAAARIIDFHNRKTFPPHLLPDFVAS